MYIEGEVSQWVWFQAKQQTAQVNDQSEKCSVVKFIMTVKVKCKLTEVLLSTGHK